MKNSTLIFLIGINFILMNLEVFLPIFSGEQVNILALLLINIFILIVINILQKRPPLKEFDEQKEVLNQFHIKAYLISTVFCCFIQLIVIVGYFSFGWGRDHIYDLIILFIVNLFLFINGEEAGEVFSS
jgi:hypothetical protein